MLGIIWQNDKRDRGPPCGYGRGAKTHDRVTDAHVSLLLNLGLLSRHSHTADQYLFATPNAGPIIKGIIGGRKVRNVSS